MHGLLAFIRVAALTLPLVFALPGCDRQEEPAAGTQAVIADYAEKEVASSGETGLIKVGFIHHEPLSDTGWVGAQEKARLALDDLPGVETLVKAGVPENGDALEAVQELIGQGCSVIVGTSFGLGDYLLQAAKLYPRVNFLHCSGYRTAPNLAVFFGKMYEARYLTGLVAGMMTYSNIIGYVAAVPVPEVIRGINAFALGVREVNPLAQVRVAWTYSWNSPELERSAALALINIGADVVAQHQNSPAVQQAAEEQQVYSIGYNTDFLSVAPNAHLTSAVWNWETFYQEALKQIRDGSWRAGMHWPGLESGIVDIFPCNPEVPDSVRELVERRRREIIRGDFSVFSGPIRDQSGRERIPEGTQADIRELLGMSWLVEGVQDSEE